MTVAMRDAYGEALVQLGGLRPDVVVLDADLGNSIRCEAFGRAYPDRYIQVGIAEQNLVGVAAGLAACGLVPVVNSFAAFAVCRALDQIRVSGRRPMPVYRVGVPDRFGESGPDDALLAHLGVDAAAIALLVILAAILIIGTVTHKGSKTTSRAA